jgi:hypothetical protein
MRLIDKIALNRLISIIGGLIVRILEIFSKHTPNDKNPLTPSKPNRPRPLKKVIDIIPFPWKK